MDLSGIIFVALALAWAFYLIPKAVKHHEDAASARSVDRFSNAMRVLSRRDHVDRDAVRVVVTPPRTSERVLVPSRSRSASLAARQAAARAAARRRRHVLLVLLVAALTVTALAVFALLPWWSIAVPVTLIVLYLFACRRQVRREHEVLWETAPATTPATTPSATPSATGDSAERRYVVPRRAIRVDAPAGRSAGVAREDAGPTDAVSRASEVELADEDTVQIPIEQLETVAVSVETEDGGSLWDPLPVTLPTYVGKARASRSVRTIDLAGPGAWSSGRDEAHSAPLAQASNDEIEEAAAEQARAVGS